MRKKKNAKVVEVRWYKPTRVWLIVSGIDGGVRDLARRRKDDAVRLARELAKEHRRELVVKNKNGRIGYRNSYGNDPRNRRG